MPIYILKGTTEKDNTMGMAASQARLLSITSRMHDLEHRAQQIMNDKVALATQEDAAYMKYTDALDNKKIQVGFGNNKFVDANFGNVCCFDPSGTRIAQYALFDSDSGKMIVENTVYEAYENYSNDKYSFAWAMLGFVEEGQYSDFSWGDNWGNNIGINSNTGETNFEYDYFCIMTDAEKAVFDNHTGDTELTGAYKMYEAAMSGTDAAEQKETLQAFRKLLYSNDSYIKEIYDYMRLDKSVDKEECLANKVYISGFPENLDDTTMREFKYYLSLFEGIEKAGGCKSALRFSDSFAKDDNEWFNNIINSGSVVLGIYQETGANKGWQSTSIATTTNENYLQEVEDKVKTKKAEAEYEHELSQIKRKDAQFDRDLSNLDVERNALTKEMDSVKKVKDDNIERTFKMDS